MDPEGFLRVGGFSIYYRSEGEPSRGTVLGLHGGPGGSYDYLVPLFDLANHGYRVVLYDQSGSGKSEVLRDRSLFVVERFVEEVEGVRKALSLGRVHLYGHSWGGMLAQAYALKYQKNLNSLLLSGTTSSVPMLEAEASRIFRTLPPNVRRAVTKYEALGDLQNPEYAAAIDVFNKKYQCLLDPWPETLKFSFSHFSLPVGETMFGLGLVTVSGNMRYWEVSDKLHHLKVPTLVICGDHDFLTQKLHRVIHQKIRGSKLVIMKGASHGAMWDARDEYIKELRTFLDSL